MSGPGDPDQEQLAAFALVREVGLAVGAGGVRQAGARAEVVGPGAFSTHNVCACTSTRNAPGPNTAEASTMPLDFHEPQFRIDVLPRRPARTARASRRC